MFSSQLQMRKPQRKAFLCPAEEGFCNIYQAFDSQVIDQKEDTVLLDCGFGQTVRIPLNGQPKPQAGAYLESKKLDGKYAFLACSSGKRQYTYKVFIEDIVDGDTLVCQVDCGFDVYSKQRLRLAHINAA